ncbi:uncharacterized protein NPIL_531631 [Nephila pilipes]|uniref:Uncharacterized protein n=1 Tax=Nephila pilipes TaxID=299642 RepID=A0A8X6PK03_NEPPI|nr:uncharacterized protein NPIL_531631 [Nephila pilipes]
MKYDSHLALCAIILLITASVFLGVGITNFSTNPLYSGPLCIVFGMVFLLPSVVLWVYAAKGPMKPDFDTHQGPGSKIQKDQDTKCQKDISTKPQKDIKYQLKPSLKSQQDPDLTGKLKLDPVVKVKHIKKDSMQFTDTVV